MRRRVALCTATVLLAGCGTSGDDQGGTLTVAAAASLTDVFTELGAVLEDQRPGLEVRFTFAGSATLAAQLLQGAPADVFASADERQMAVVTGAGLAADPEIFAANALTIAVPEGNPAGVTGLADFAREELTLAVCATQVPCGAAAAELLDVAGVEAVPDTYEEDVRAALTKVALGEVDAALVYVTDARSRADAVDVVEVPEAASVVTVYPVCVLADAPRPEAAQAFVDLVLSAEGRRILADAGFRPP
ncbi:molybdate ABC transporter substrate-binding protein [Blastococcus goldschmidtiae]|uniref:Molybdate ABC transporter substrate-binding protein n=1 Tax=Blastococcus goldschmidtiae TaxID=3075546 RepID=A0ABU2K2V7_9ACTN|nr:molybdate ABC transporter substrate-binding protein [Blastococcus sp. DSM 46792]MDT0274517.1 molybdate ABC transporter substrate-binding protein [Blastococcus sp. DSM 46792]